MNESVAAVVGAPSRGRLRRTKQTPSCSVRGERVEALLLLLSARLRRRRCAALLSRACAA